MNERREILNIDEAAQLLGVSVKTFNKVLHSENVPGRKIGREWKFSRQALIDWIGNGRSDRFYEIQPQARGSAATPARPPVRPENGEVPPGPSGPPGGRRTTGWRLKMD